MSTYSNFSNRLKTLPTWLDKKYIYLYDGLKVRNTVRKINKEVDKSNCLCLDSETYKGHCRLLADSDSRYILEPTFKECLDFLMYRYNDNSIYRFFFNIDFDISAIMKLNKDKEFLDKVSHGYTTKFQDYEIYWINGKMFSLKRKNHKVVYTDINSFLHMSLNKAVKKYVDSNLGKDKIDGNLLNTSLEYWDDNLNDIIQYCIKDCKLTQYVGNIFIESLKKAEIVLPKYLVSSASLSKSHFRKHCNFPSIQFIPKKILNIAWKTYHGGRFELLDRGYFKKLFCFDVNSEYPDFMRLLPSFKYGIWKQIDYLTNQPSFSLINATLIIPKEVRISTITNKLPNGMNIWANGYQNGWFTWYDLDLMRDYIKDINDCWIYVPSSKEYYPYEQEINNLYAKKRHFKYVLNEHTLELVVKLTMNAKYGTNIEKHTRLNKYGKEIYESGILFNSVYGTFITGYGRWKILKDIHRNNWKYIHGFHTDSVITSKFLNELDLGKELGQWSLETNENGIQGILLNTGQYQIGNDKCKTRGIPKKYIKNWFRFLRKRKLEGLQEIQFTVNRMLKIREALKQHKIERMNEMKDTKKTIRINSDKKRTWNDDFIDFHDILERNIASLPLIRKLDGNYYYNDNRSIRSLI